MTTPPAVPTTHGRIIEYKTIPPERRDGARSLAVGVPQISEEQLVEPPPKVSSFTRVGGFVGSEQDEPQRSLPAPNGRQLEVHLVIGSARPQRRPNESVRALRPQDSGFHFIRKQFEPRSSARPARLSERLPHDPGRCRQRTCPRTDFDHVSSVDGSAQHSPSAADADFELTAEALRRRSACRRTDPRARHFLSVLSLITDTEADGDRRDRLQPGSLPSSQLPTPSGFSSK